MGLPVHRGVSSVGCSQRVCNRDGGRENRTIGGTLRGRALAATTADTHAVDNVALLGLVAEAASLVGARRAGGAVDNVQLTVLY